MIMAEKRSPKPLPKPSKVSQVSVASGISIAAIKELAKQLVGGSH
jgi:hypothetical protein